MISVRTGRWRFSLVTAALMLVAGCSSSGEKEIPDYFNARVVPPLQLPADLDSPYRAQEMQLPEEAFRMQFSPDTDVEALARPPRLISGNDS